MRYAGAELDGMWGTTIRQSKTPEVRAAVAALVGTWAEMRVTDSGRITAYVPVRLVSLRKDYGHMRWVVETVDGKQYAVTTERLRVALYTVPDRRDGKVWVDMTAPDPLANPASPG